MSISRNEYYSTVGEESRCGEVATLLTVFSSLLNFIFFPLFFLSFFLFFFYLLIYTLFYFLLSQVHSPRCHVAVAVAEDVLRGERGGVLAEAAAQGTNRGFVKRMRKKAQGMCGARVLGVLC